jgi:hypothetical protein
MTISAGATLSLSGSNGADLDTGTLTNDGTINWSGKGPFNGSNGATINNAAAFNISGDSSSGGLTLNNSGTITKTSPIATGITVLAGVVNNHATIDVNSGTLGLDAGGPNPIQVETGIFDAAAGAVLDFSSTYYGGDTGDVQINARTQFPGAGLYEFDHGTLSINGNLSVASFTMTGGTVNGPATLTVTGAFHWTGGDLDGTGTTTVAHGATLALGGPNNLSLTNGHVLNNAGAATWSGVAQLNGSNGSVLNNSGTFAITNDSTSDGLIVNNAGTLTKTSPTGAGTTEFGNYGGPFNNTGTVNIHSGILALPGGGADSSATFNIAKGAELYVGLDHWGYPITDVLAGTVSFLGTGSVVLDGGALAAGAAGATIQIGSSTTFDWSSGSLGAPVGSTLNLKGTVFLIGTSNEVLYGGGTVNLAGTINQTGTGSLRIDGTSTTATTLAIDSGSTYNLAADTGIAQGANDGGVVANAGTIRKTVGTAVSTIATPLNNTGTVAVSTGTLDVTGAVSQVNGTTLQAGTWTCHATPSWIAKSRHPV